MDEIEKKKEEIEKLKKEEPEKEVEEESLIKLANTAAERIERANEITAKNTKAQQEVLSEMKLQGRGIAGQAPQKEEKESEIDFANNMMQRGDNLLIPK